MPHMREAKTCDRCRHFKRRCDLLKPQCTRCIQAGVRCSFNTDAQAQPEPAFHLSSLASTLLPPPMPQQQPAPTHASVFPSLSADLSALPAPHQHHLVHHHHHRQRKASSPPFPTPTSANVPHINPVASIASTDSAASPAREDLDLGATPSSNGVLNGLISPITSTESPEPGSASSTAIYVDGPPPPPPPADGSPADQALPRSGQHQQRIVRKRKRNCLSCLRCHRLKVKCDKELPCGRCKASGNGRECYYSYNKGPNGGKFPCPTAPVPSSRDEKKPQMATWQVQHRVRGSSHWRELMIKVRHCFALMDVGGAGDGEQGPRRPRRKVPPEIEPAR